MRTFLVLGRVSNVPTVWTNCLAGWLLAGGGEWTRFAWLCAGATLVYLGGMFLNDAFDAEFDAVICLCQGAFGLMTATGDDDVVFGHMARALRPGGVLALSAFSSYFVVKYFESAVFDAATGVNHEHTEVRNEAGEARTVDLWTGCYTPRELRLLCAQAGLRVESISSVEPGSYALAPPTVESAEFLLVARRA